MRRGIAGTMVLWLLLAGIALIAMIVVITRLYEGGRDELDASGCTGSIADVVDGTGTCMTSAACADVPAKDGHEYMTVGEVFDCKGAKRDGKAAPYCCIEVRRG